MGNKYRQEMIERMVSALVAGGVPQERAQLIAARHAAGESTRVFRPGSNLPVSLPIWKFLPTATWCDVPLAGIYTEYGPDGKIIREVSVDSARAQAAAVLGSISTPKKTAAARANGAKGGRPVKRVQLINPWSGAMPEDKNLAWDEIRAWAQGHVHPDDLPGWLRRARQAFRDNDGAALGTMIIGS